MKKVLSMILVLVLCISMCACSAQNSNSGKSEDSNTYSLGETIETDILRITLNNAQLAIKLNGSRSVIYDKDMNVIENTLSPDYFTAEEYNPEDDVGAAYIAPKGHTYVAIEFKAKNLDRAYISFDSPMDNQFITIEYAGEKYDEPSNYGCNSTNGYEWEKYDISGIGLIAGEEYYYRCYIDIPIDVSNLKDEIAVIFHLPSSNGETTQYKYVVTDSDRQSMASQEPSIEKAIAIFNEEAGQSYFKAHMEEYILLNANEIYSSIIGPGIMWDITIVEPSGYWKGGFMFEVSGEIKEDIPLIGVGYYNNRTWAIAENELVLDGEYSCEIRKVSDGVYLFVCDGSPYAVLHTDNPPNVNPVCFRTITLDDRATANNILELWRAGEATDASMKALMDEYGADQGGGQLYELYEVERDFFLEEIATWCLDSSRKVGDVEIIKTVYGYAIVYIVSLGNS